MDPQAVFAYDSFRPGQRELAVRVREAALSGETLVAEAMSGFGKTAAVLSGALMAAEESGSKVVYACRTKRQVNRVVEEIARLQKKHPFTAASMLSKFDYCLLKRGAAGRVSHESFGWYCTFNVSNNLCSYFLNVPLMPVEFDRAVKKALAATPPQADLVRDSESIHVCPYEVARLALVQSKLAVVPYQYVFDQRCVPVLFDRESMKEDGAILVVDEAHNLRDFMRGLRSATLSLDQIGAAAKEAESMLLEQASSSLKSLSELLEEEIAGCDGWLMSRDRILDRFRESRGPVWLQNLAFELSSCSGAAWGLVAYEKRLPAMVLKVGEFLARLSSWKRSVLVKWDTTIGLIDPDPVDGLAQRLKEFRSAVLLSGTISPSAVFLRSLGLDLGGVSTYEVSATPEVTVRTVIDTGTTTRYRSRTPEMYSKISGKIAAVIGATPNGVGVFVPSYAVMSEILEPLSAAVLGRNMVREEPGLSNEEASDRFDSFRSVPGSVLLAVQGGRFSEGEDFREDLMGSVIVAGLSLPPPSPMLFAEYASLKHRGEPDSFLMLSRLPALRKAFQAAGRHIRKPGKRGLVFLLDDRFGSATVRELMPPWLRADVTAGDFAPGDLAKIAREFWDLKGPRPSLS